MIEYVVTLRNKEDLDDFYYDMETPGGSITIPNRNVSISKRRKISRNTHYMLTPEEAEMVRNDPRVLAVMPADLERAAIKPHYTQTANFEKSSNNVNTHKNWGLYRCITGEQTANWGSDLISSVQGTITASATGKNVDVIIIDGHINPDHPEFAVNNDGTGGSRVVQLNWHIYSTQAGTLDDDAANVLTGDYVYTPYDFASSGSELLDADNNHGAHVAGTACGNTQGWARDANIYNISPYSTNSNALDSLAMWDYIRAFHLNKSINPVTGKKNPTVCNGSYGSGIEFNLGDFGPITRAVYRGTDTGVTSGLTTQQLLDNGIYDAGSQTPYVPYYSVAVEADIQDAIADGIHVVGASGNESFYVANSTDTDYGNYCFATYLGVNYIWYYHRGSAPAAVPGAICVGNVGSLTAETKANSSNCGPRVDIYAPGTNIMSSFNSNYSYGGTADSRNTSYVIGKISGTSMASPQVCGILACVLETYPEMTPAQALEYLVSYSKKDQMGDTGGSYSDRTSLNGAPNRYLYFNKERKDSGSVYPKTNYSVRPTTGAVYPRPRSKLVQPQTRIVTDGLVLHLDAANLKSYPGSGTTWFDLSGNGNNGTLSGGPTYSSVAKGSIFFDGVDDEMVAPISSSSSEYSINWWTYPTSLLDYNQAIWIEPPSGWGTFEFHTSANGAVYVGTTVLSRIEPTELPAGTVELNNWNNFTFTFNSGLGKFFKNGNLLYAKALTVSGETISAIRANTIHGNLSVLSVYGNRALSEVEVEQNFNALRGRYGI